MGPPVTPGRKGAGLRFRSKFAVSYEALLDGEHPWSSIPGSGSSSSLTGTPTPLTSSYSNTGSSYFSSKGKKPSAPRSRFFADLLCLKVERATIAQLIQNIPSRVLLDDDEGSKGARIRVNIGSLWRESLRIWSDVEQAGAPSSPTSRFDSNQHGSDEVRRSNAVDTLLVLSSSILTKNALSQSSTSMDLIWIFAGGIDEADDVFEGLVSAIDEALRGELDNVNYHRRRSRPSRMPSSDFHSNEVRTNSAQFSEPPTLQDLLHHRFRATQLAIVWISFVSSSNLAAYFVRRDLFIAACSLLSTVQALMESAARSAQEHGGLAEADEELLQSVVRNATLLIGLLAGLGYGGTTVSSSASSSAFTAAGPSHSPYFRRLCDWVDSGSMALLRECVSQEFEQAWRTYETEESPFRSANDAGPLSWSAASTLGLVSDGVKRLGLGRADSANFVLDANDSFPPLACCVLLPVYLLTRANQALVQIAFTAPPEQENHAKFTFASSFVSLSSYLATHASHSPRSRSYSRLMMLTLLSILSSTAGLSAVLLTERPDEAALVEQCQQRSGPIKVSGGSVDSSSSGLFSYFSQLSLTSTASDAKKPSRLLPFIIDSCVQYLRYNLRKRLDVSGYLICLEVIKTSIGCCAERRMQLEYQGWVEVWRSIQTVIAFLVGRHTELKGIEIGTLGKALLTTLSFALLESDHFLRSKDDVNVLIYELVRNGEALRRIACIAVTGKDPADGNVDDAMLKVAAVKIVEDIPGWRLIDMVLLTFEHQLEDWKNKKGSAGGFSLGFDLSSLTGGYLKSGPDHTKRSASLDMPDVDTVKQLISSLDLEVIVSSVAGVEGGNSSKSSGTGSNTKTMKAKAAFLNQEWLERAESQCIAEAFRCASEDMRSVIASPL